MNARNIRNGVSLYSLAFAVAVGAESRKGFIIHYLSHLINYFSTVVAISN
jgi:hypothetical protein